MDRIMANGRNDTEEDLLRRASHGDEAALAALFGRYRKRLRQMVRLRLDRRLQGRVDPSTCSRKRISMWPSSFHTT
jgi:hypothetical protein